MTIRPVLPLILALGLSAPAAADPNVNRLCDTQFENCRARLRWYIQHEPEAIDIAMSYMSDLRYTADLIQRHREGLPIRVLMNQPATNGTKRDAHFALEALRDAGVPMRQKRGGKPLHWKVMLFHGLQRMEISKANYTAESFVPGFREEGGSAKRGFFDEVIGYFNDPRLLASYVTQFENYWTDTVLFSEYANSPDPPVRQFPSAAIDPTINFHPIEDFNRRAVGRMVLEPVGIDVVEFRLTYPPAVDALIAAHQQGRRVRVIVEPEAWGNPTTSPHQASMARLVAAGVPVKQRIHAGLTHEGLIVLHGLQEAIFGSSNLHDGPMLDTNLFFAPGQGPVLHDGRTAYDWFAAHFDRKWADDTAFAPWVVKSF